MDRFTALTVFRQAVELGSFAAASRRLGMSPPAVTKNISELESHLSVRLFNRTTRHMSLTEAGSFYYEHVVRVLDELEEANNALSEMQNLPKGLLRVSAPMTVSLICLSSSLPRFLDQYPEMSVDLHLDDRYVDIVQQGFDVALRGSDNLEDSSLVARKLLTMEHVVVGAPSYFERCGTPRSPQDLAQHNCVQFSLSGHANEWTFQKDGRSLSLPINGRYKVTSSLAVRDALRAGFGLSLVPWIYVREDLEKSRLVTVLDDYSPNKTMLYAVYPSRRYVLSKVRAFVDFLVEELRQIRHAQDAR